MHTGTCQHVGPVINGTAQMNARIPACIKCAKPMQLRKFEAKGIKDRPFAGLEVLLSVPTNSEGKFTGPFPKFVIPGQR